MKKLNDLYRFLKINNLNIGNNFNIFKAASDEEMATPLRRGMNIGRYIYTNKIYNVGRLFLNEENKDILHNAFSRTYEKEAGSAFNKEEFMSRMPNWTIYGNLDLDYDGKIINEDKINFIAYRAEEAGILKINAIVGDNKREKFKIIKDFSENFNSRPCYTAVTQNLVSIMERFGMINLSVPENSTMLKLLSVVQFKNFSGASINDDGSIDISMFIGGTSKTTKKYLCINRRMAEYLKMTMENGVAEGKVDKQYSGLINASLHNILEKFKSNPISEKLNSLFDKQYVESTRNFDTSTLERGIPNTERSYFEKYLFGKYNPKQFNKDYSEIYDKKFFKENFAYLHILNMYQTDIRKEGSITTIDRMIADFKNNSQQIDLSVIPIYIGDITNYKNTIASALEKYKTRGFVFIVDGEPAFANVVDSVTKRISPDHPEKGFREFSNKTLESLYWDEPSFIEAMRGYDQHYGETVLKNWSIVGMYVNPQFFQSNQFTMSEISFLSFKHNVPVYLQLEKDEAVISSYESKVKVQDEGEIISFPFEAAVNPGWEYNFAISGINGRLNSIQEILDLEEKLTPSRVSKTKIDKDLSPEMTKSIDEKMHLVIKTYFERFTLKDPFDNQIDYNRILEELTDYKDKLYILDLYYDFNDFFSELLRSDDDLLISFNTNVSLAVLLEKRELVEQISELLEEEIEGFVGIEKGEANVIIEAVYRNFDKAPNAEIVSFAKKAYELVKPKIKDEEKLKLFAIQIAYKVITKLNNEEFFKNSVYEFLEYIEIEKYLGRQVIVDTFFEALNGLSSLSFFKQNIYQKYVSLVTEKSKYNRYLKDHLILKLERVRMEEDGPPYLPQYFIPRIIQNIQYDKNIKPDDYNKLFDNIFNLQNHRYENRVYFSQGIDLILFDLISKSNRDKYDKAEMKQNVRNLTIERAKVMEPEMFFRYASGALKRMEPEYHELLVKVKSRQLTPTLFFELKVYNYFYIDQELTNSFFSKLEKLMPMVVHKDAVSKEFFEAVILKKSKSFLFNSTEAFRYDAEELSKSLNTLKDKMGEDLYVLVVKKILNHDISKIKDEALEQKIALINDLEKEFDNLQINMFKDKTGPFAKELEEIKNILKDIITKNNIVGMYTKHSASNSIWNKRNFQKLIEKLLDSEFKKEINKSILTMLVAIMDYDEYEITRDSEARGYNTNYSNLFLYQTTKQFIELLKVSVKDFDSLVSDAVYYFDREHAEKLLKILSGQNILKEFDNEHWDNIIDAAESEKVNMKVDGLARKKSNNYQDAKRVLYQFYTSKDTKGFFKYLINLKDPSEEVEPYYNKYVSENKNLISHMAFLYISQNNHKKEDNIEITKWIFDNTDILRRDEVGLENPNFENVKYVTEDDFGRKRIEETGSGYESGYTTEFPVGEDIEQFSYNPGVNIGYYEGDDEEYRKFLERNNEMDKFNIEGEESSGYGIIDDEELSKKIIKENRKKKLLKILLKKSKQQY